MRVAFRVDASLQIGSGHVMRCLALAEELRKRGADIVFVCREHEGNLVDVIQDKGFSVAALGNSERQYAPHSGDPKHAAWLGSDWEEDAAATREALKGLSLDWLIIDHYGLDRKWEEKLRPYVDRIMVIDDLADRTHDCDLLLDQNLCRSMNLRYKDLVPQNCRELLGPKYALLRSEFAAARENLVRRWAGGISRVLVFFGGVDATEETEKTIEAISRIENRSYEVDVVVGQGNTRKERIRELCLSLPKIHYYEQINHMSEMMAKADLAIGACGTATWERCTLGLPSLVITVADNQTELAACGAEKGYFFYLGDAKVVTSDRIQQALSLFVDAPHTLKGFSENGMAITDGRGVQRVAGEILPPTISLRPARMEDCDSVYRWRNAEETRRFIFDSSSIEFSAHEKWFRNSLEREDRIILIGEISGKPVGVVRYDIEGSAALISIYLVPGGQGQGVGTELIRSGSRWLKQNRPSINEINAEILRTNIPSLRAFERAGFIEHHVTFKRNIQ